MSTAAMERPQQRPRSKSTFSFKSDKSHGSNKQKKEQYHESPEDKRRSHLTSTTKANPNAAMTEIQPIAAALEKPTLQSLRSFQHTDMEGNPIAEPDLSNPTRSRWERPLDTIRSFEAAIDNEYKRRSVAMRGNDAATDVMSGFASRRSSYYGGHDQNRHSYNGGGGHYGSRQAAAARESWHENSYGPPAPRARYSAQRMQSDPGWNRYGNGQGVYPHHGYQQSRDTVNTGASNGSNSEPTYSTDPSSDNSSIERAPPPPKQQQQPDLGEQYGFAGFGGGPQYQGPILEEYGQGMDPGPSSGGGHYPQQQYPTYHNIPPPVPAKKPLPPINTNVMNLNSQPGPPAPASRPNVLSRKSTNDEGKRKSWLKRRFSKNN
ncbi:hypothetical protein EJ04DRAFT_356861 [Polyplosphaeria fusca]|uniref:Uncharacterized protein n=1 Tax=Polyplosphaeria fusca TaxID=682080 RepID=A0A9P4V7H6_9PLEO|nr:hypothetical protein EJ04DRAFT_356861 [Polyplosphaeria fusca]